MRRRQVDDLDDAMTIECSGSTPRSESRELHAQREQDAAAK
jgi:hypothetical protein